MTAYELMSRRSSTPTPAIITAAAAAQQTLQQQQQQHISMALSSVIIRRPFAFAFTFAECLCERVKYSCAACAAWVYECVSVCVSMSVCAWVRGCLYLLHFAKICERFSQTVREASGKCDLQAKFTKYKLVIIFYYIHNMYIYINYALRISSGSVFFCVAPRSSLCYLR